MPLDPHVKTCLDMLRTENASVPSVEDCVINVRSKLRLLGVDESIFAALEKAAEMMRKKPEIKIEITNHDKQRRWYNGPADDAVKWPALRAYLQNVKKYSESTILSLDKASDEIVSMLGNPASIEKTQRRGLVIGYVQSGKTANMTAVIAKAADEGYNMVVVLTGLTNKLRQQTQKRIEEDLVDFQNLKSKWVLHTTRELAGDFSSPLGLKGSFVVYDNIVNLLVIKKTTREKNDKFGGPLGKLESALNSTPAADLKKLRVLVIDDECDQGSVNAANRERDVAPTNKCLRRILSRLHFVTYVGYTATPFANVLINPYPRDNARVDGNQLDDLYPASFITSLPRPDGYFGPERIFGNLAGDSQDEETYGLPYLKDVPPNDEKRLQPEKPSEKDDFTPEMTESLEDAILYFLACCSARIERGDECEHMTMLIHTSMYKSLHKSVANLAQNWTVQQQASLTDPSSDISRRLIRVYEDEQEKMKGHFPDLQDVAPDKIHAHLPSVLHELEFPIENGDADADERLDFSDDKPKRYIVTGGTILSRGLTLDGLVVSYFLRSTRQFDTLLQMGRWFGYRTNYEDLPRIWTTPELQEGFAQLAEVEAHIRSDVARYSEHDMTPMDLAVRIPVVPGMAITGAARMRHAREVRLSYDGQHEQTTRFHHHDRTIVDGNWKAGSDLLSEAEQLGCRSSRGDRFLWTRVPLSAIGRFFESYHPHEAQKSLSPNLLRNYLDSCHRKNKLTQWNVGIVSRRSSDEVQSVRLGPVEVMLNQRSQMRNSLPGSAWLKSLSSSRDCLFDLNRDQLPSTLPTKNAELRELRKEHAEGIPLLLLYPLDANAPARGGDQDRDRKSLDAIDNLLGYAIQFPASEYVDKNLVAIDVNERFYDEEEQ